MPENIKILGHRGTRHNPVAHENTLPAFAHALYNADGVEADVVCSADNVPYLLHNSSIRFIPHLFSWVATDWHAHLHPASRALVKGRDIHEMFSAEIDQVCMKDGNSIPRLSHLFELVSRCAVEKTMNLELKAPATAGPVLAEIFRAEKAGIIDRTRIILSSFDHDEIASVQRLDPSIKTGLIFWQDSVRPCRLYPGNEKHPARALPISIKNLENEQIRGIMPDYFVLPVQGLTKVYSDAVAAAYPKSKLIVWTAGNEPLPERNGALQGLLNSETGRRIAAVITNHPESMRKFLRPL